MKFDLPTIIYKIFDWPINALLCLFVNTDLISKSVVGERNYFIKNGSSTKIDFLNTMLGAIQTRASAAISHISIMMGVTVLLLVRYQDHEILKYFMITEIFVYIILLLLCLRCVRSMTLNDGVLYKEFEKVYNKELIYRFSTLQLINSGLVIATVGFFGIIISYAYHAW